MRSPLTPTLAAVAVALPLLAACGSSSNQFLGSTAASADAATAAATGTSSADVSQASTAATAATAAAPAAAGKVNANTASQEELAKAFSAAGVPSADRWAREVAEYRPYSGTDDWAHLRKELDKYNIDPGTFAKIISVLTV